MNAGMHLQQGGAFSICIWPKAVFISHCYPIYLPRSVAVVVTMSAPINGIPTPHEPTDQGVHYLLGAADIPFIFPMASKIARGDRDHMRSIVNCIKWFITKVGPSGDLRWGWVGHRAGNCLSGGNKEHITLNRASNWARVHLSSSVFGGGCGREFDFRR